MTPALLERPVPSKRRKKNHPVDDRMRPARENRMLLEGVSWETYLRLSEECESRGTRMTFDDGRLEIVNVSFLHENFTRFFDPLIRHLCKTVGTSFRHAGMMTMRVNRRRKGLEPDNCYFIARRDEMKGKKEWLFERDPPPDLAIEIDLSTRLLDKLPIYSALGVPEVWTFDGEDLAIFRRNARGGYAESPTTPTFADIPAATLGQLIVLGPTLDIFEWEEHVATTLQTAIRPKRKKS